jgi:uncharacterized protein
MTEQETIVMVRQGYDCYKRGDIQSVINMCADDIEWILPEVDGAPFTGTWRGKQEVARYFQTFNQCLRTLKFEIRDIVAGEDKAVMIGYFAGEVIPTGRSLENEIVHVLTYSDGKLQRFQQFGDTAATQAAFSTAPAGMATGQTSQALH